jgi:sec-independent protein translocase protein TatC
MCLIAGNYVVDVLKRPLKKARIAYAGTNQVVTVYFSTNRLGVYSLAPEQEQAFNLGTNRFLAVQLQPAQVGTNTVLTFRVDNNPELAESAQRLNVDLLNLSPASGFFVAFQVALYGGLVIASPLIFYFIAAFVFPALKLNEKYYVYRGLGFGLGLFLTGVAFCYFALMPIALAASAKYSQWLGFAANQWKADDYISFVCKFMLGMGLGFEMPVVILTLVKIGVLNYRILAKGRRYMIVINLVLGAVLTTPEVITQLIMFLPLQCLYEISIWVAWYWERKAKKREAEAAPSGEA